MELRKLIGFGKATYSITLPKKWVKDNALVKGDLILIQEKSPEKLEISPKLTEQPELVKEAIINVKDKSLEQIERELIFAYINDYSIINITGEVQKNLKQIREMLNELIGLEIMEISPDKMVAKVFSDVTNTHISNVIRRIALLSRSMMDDLEAIFNGETNFHSLIEKDVEINRQTFFASRILTKAIKSSYFRGIIKMELMEAASALRVIDEQERMADKIKITGRQFSQLLPAKKIKPQHKKAFVGYLRRIHKLYENIVQAYLTQNKELASKTMEEVLKVRMELEVYMKSNTEVLVPFITGNLGSLGAYIADLGLIVFNTES